LDVGVGVVGTLAGGVVAVGVAVAADGVAVALGAPRGSSSAVQPNAPSDIKTISILAPAFTPPSCIGRDMDLCSYRSR
jgi:hypothetical protein